MSCRMPITENALVASLNSFKKSCNASAFAHSYSLGAWWYCSTANLFKAYVAFQQCGTSRTSPDLLLKPSDLTMELKICMRDGDEVTTLIISRTLPIALGITFRPAWTIMLRTWAVLAPTSVTTGKQWWRPQMPIGVVGISWTTNKSARARNTTVAFYPGVYWGVIYISAGKAMSERIYRSVGELYLD